MGLCLAGLALLMAWHRRLRSSIALGALAFVWLWAWSTPVLSLWLRGTVEDQYYLLRYPFGFEPAWIADQVRNDN